MLRKLGNPHKEFSRPRQGGKQALHFLNYLELGIDLGFNEESQRLQKIILRTNQLTDPIFGFYDRCNFVLPLSLEESKEQISSFMVPQDDDKADLTITPITRFGQVKEALSKNEVDQPDVHYVNNLHQDCLFNNSTHFYGYPGLVVEVIP